MRTAEHLQASCSSLREEAQSARLETLAQRSRADAQIGTLRAEVRSLPNQCLMV
jgi:hypothetical protein